MADKLLGDWPTMSSLSRNSNLNAINLCSFDLTMTARQEDTDGLVTVIEPVQETPFDRYRVLTKSIGPMPVLNGDRTITDVRPSVRPLTGCVLQWDRWCQREEQVRP